MGDLRNLEVDNRLVVPVGVPLTLCLGTTDVIHSFSLPSVGLKLDANVGALNFIELSLDHTGVFRGSCSEICGVNHSFMPIGVETTSPGFFVA